MLSMVESMDAESKSTKNWLRRVKWKMWVKEVENFFCSFPLFVFRVSYPELVCLGL